MSGYWKCPRFVSGETRHRLGTANIAKSKSENNVPRGTVTTQRVNKWEYRPNCNTKALCQSVVVSLQPHKCVQPLYGITDDREPKSKMVGWP